MAYRHILVPFDGSPLAQVGISLAAWIAWRAGGEVDLVRVVPHWTGPFGTRRLPAMERGEVSRLAQQKTLLALHAARLREKGISATGGAFAGEPVTVLLDYLTRHAIDLVVMGTHGRSLAQRWIVGSVATDMARRSSVPVLLVPRKSKPLHDDELRVLVAMDGSAAAAGALEAALELGATVPSQITLFQVLPGEGPSSDQKTMEWYEQPVLSVSGYLDQVQEQVSKKGVNVRRAYSAGDPAAEIELYTSRGQFDMIALGTRGLTGLSRLVWGSVAEHVAKYAHVPVLLTSGARIAAERPPSRKRQRVVGPAGSSSKARAHRVRSEA